MLKLRICQQILRGLLVCLCLLGIVACSSQSESTLTARDLELDMKLWSVYTKAHAVRLDVEKTFKHKKLTPKEAEICFQRNKDTLNSLAAEIKEIQRSQEQGYSGQVQELVQAVDSALALAKKAYLEKRIADFQGAKEVWQTLQNLSKEIPRQRTRHLLQKGCSTQQVYELFRESGVSEQDIQEFILQARAEEQQQEDSPAQDSTFNNEQPQFSSPTPASGGAPQERAGNSPPPAPCGNQKG